MSNATLIDTTKCIGCRSCQVTCKQWNDLPAENTALQPGLGLQNPRKLSASTFVVIQSTEVDDAKAPGGLKYVFSKRQCMHCDEPACASACPVTALHKTKEGPVVYDDAKCLGCRYCMWACPFGVPTAEWNSLAPKIRKCTHCFDRLSQPAPEERNGQALSDEDRKRFAAAHALPACVKQCPAERSSTASVRPSSRRPAPAWRRRPASTWTTSTVSTRRAGPACCICRRCRSRSSGSPRWGRRATRPRR